MVYLVILSLFLFSCGGASPDAVDLRVEPGLEELWQSLSALPGAPSAVSVTGPRLELFTRFWRDGRDAAAETPPSPAPEAGPGTGRVAGRRYFAPAVPLLDPRRSVGFEELAGGVQGGAAAVGPPVSPTAPVVKPLDEIRPPEKALAVDGLYPGDGGYPLVDEVIVRLDTAAVPEKGASILEWFRGIPEPPARRVVRIAAVGDIMPGRGVDRVLLGSPDALERIFGDTLPVLRGADLALGNIEGAITLRTGRVPKSYNFRFRPEILRPLREAGFDYLAATNNHVYDYGEGGLLDTIDALRESGIGTSGIGRNLEEASRPWETMVEGLRVRILSVGAYPREYSGFDGRLEASAGPDRPGILWADDSGLRAMKRAFLPDAINIVMVHGGHEWRNEPSRDQRELYRSFIDAGAHIVLGSHPHVLQTVEGHSGGLVAYSLGNFIFPGMDETLYGEETMILCLGIFDGGLRYADFYPARIDNQVVRLDRTGEILRRFIGLGGGR